MSEESTDRHGYAVSAGKDGDPAVTAASVQGATQPATDLATAIAHIKAAVAVLERIAAQ